jgi:hypothetical protein
VPLKALIPICTNDAWSILRILEVLARKDGSLTQEQANERADAFGSQCHPRSPRRRWLNLLPRWRAPLDRVDSRSRFAFKGIFKGPSSNIRGHAAGHGDVELKGETKEKTITLNVPASHRIGGYVVMHTPGSIYIELMWAETKMDQSGSSCLLDYDIASKEPEEMRIAAQKSLSVLFLTFNYISYVPWKQPA